MTHLEFTQTLCLIDAFIEHAAGDAKQAALAEIEKDRLLDEYLFNALIWSRV